MFNDKEWIAADPVSGTVYVTWTRFTFDGDGNYLESPITSVRSTNFGRAWSAPRRRSVMAAWSIGSSNMLSGATPSR